MFLMNGHSILKCFLHIITLSLLSFSPYLHLHFFLCCCTKSLYNVYSFCFLYFFKLTRSSFLKDVVTSSSSSIIIPFLLCLYVCFCVCYLKERCVCVQVFFLFSFKYNIFPLKLHNLINRNYNAQVVAIHKYIFVCI